MTGNFVHAGAKAMSLTLCGDELRDLTGGYVRPADQLRVLHQRGFFRAAILRGQVVLERSHYDAVTRAHLGDTPGKRPMLKSQRQKATA
jgi:hypothetical protein